MRAEPLLSPAEPRGSVDPRSGFGRDFLFFGFGGALVRDIIRAVKRFHAEQVRDRCGTDSAARASRAVISGVILGS